MPENYSTSDLNRWADILSNHMALVEPTSMTSEGRVVLAEAIHETERVRALLETLQRHVLQMRTAYEDFLDHTFTYKSFHPEQDDQ